jgi:hypothetical protein
MSPTSPVATAARWLFLPLLALLPACTSIQSVSVTQIPTDRARPLRAEVSNTAFLGIHFDNDFLDDLVPQLMRQCPRGRITGLLTKQENSLYVVVATRRVIATGYCVYDPVAPAPAVSVAAAEPASAPSSPNSAPAASPSGTSPAAAPGVRW